MVSYFTYDTRQKSLGCLAGFLWGGVKGLMIMAYGWCCNMVTNNKLFYFILFTQTIFQNNHQSSNIHEPVWPHTQKLILKTMSQALPHRKKDTWSHTEISTLEIATAISKDFAHFCVNRRSPESADHVF